MKKVEIYSVDYCPYCQKAKELLNSKHIPFTEIDITENEDAYRQDLADIYHISGTVTVPQIVIDGKRIGGFDNLEELNTSGELDKLVAD